MDSTTTVTLLHIRQCGFLPQTDYDTNYLQRVVPIPLLYSNLIVLIQYLNSICSSDIYGKEIFC